MTRSERAPDDSRHPILSRARPLSQTALDSFEAQGAPLLGPDAYGATEVKEVDARTALTPCGLPGEPWSLNPYVGCAHACAYCYVPDIQRVERSRWSSYVIVKRNLPSLLARELRRKERRPVYMSSGTDAYQPVEASQRMTRRCLELLADADWPLRLLTRSPLVRRDVDLLARFTDVQVGLSVPTVDDALRRAVEPGAPPVEGRLRALRDLADAGLRPFASLVPAYPFLNGVRPSDVAEAFRDARVAVVHVGAWQYLDSILQATAERLPEDAREAFVAGVGDPRLVSRQFDALSRAFRAAGVRMEVIGPAPQRRARREIRWVEGASGRRPPDRPIVAEASISGGAALATREGTPAAP